jgi:rod shape-determining protein MreB
VYSRSLRIASYRMDEAIIDYARRRYGLLIGERTAERVKIEIGSAYPLPRPLSFPVKGRDLTLGLPRTVNMNDEDIREALVEPLNAIVAAILLALEHAPPELGGDIFERGIILTGGGSMLRALDERIHAETGVPVLRAEEPLASAVLGTGKMLEDYTLLRRVCLN